MVAVTGELVRERERDLGGCRDGGTERCREVGKQGVEEREIVYECVCSCLSL